MKRYLTILLLLLVAGEACAQGGVLILNGHPNANVTQSAFGPLVSAAGTNATANRVGLQAKLDAGPWQYPWFFPGSTTNGHGYAFDDTLVIPTQAGRAWAGCGYSTHSGQMSKLGSRLYMQASVHGTTFNGTANKLTSSGSGAIAVVTGRATTARDVGNSVHITGGTLATTGWYGIVASTPGASGAGTWTLDRNWCTGAVENGAGTYRPALIFNLGMGMTHSGLQFSGRILDAEGTNRASVLYHIGTFSQSGNLTSTGKHSFHNCTFGHGEVGILCGADLANAWGGGTTWTGENHNNADLLRLDHVRIDNVRTAIYLRNQQSVGHEFSQLEINNLEGEAIYCDAGGKINVNGINLQGNAAGTTQCILRLGPKVNSGNSPFTVRSFGFDGGTSTRNPQLIKTDWVGLALKGNVLFDGGLIARTTGTHDDEYLIDVQGQMLLTVRKVVGNGAENSLGFWADSVKLGVGPNNGTVTHKPRVVFEDCMLDITTNPEEIIHDGEVGGSGAGATVIFIRCIKATTGELIGSAPDYTESYTTVGPP